MAVKQYSRKMTMHLALVVLLGWLCLLIWAMGQWALHGYASAFDNVSSLVDKQRQAITPVYQGSLLSTLPMDNHFQFSLDHLYIAKLSFNEITADLVTKAQQLIKLMLLTSQCMLIKLMILLAAMPLFALAMIAGLVDGLNQRAIRTACLGRESSYVFHRLNHYFRKGLVIVLMIWLAMPISITPAYVFIPISLMLALMVAMTASRFKKYL
ncbi:integrating conjugative element membrane protein%2C PFL_4697 family [Legionella pneumophila]|uniref:TIGR03747 family integrating conjugative element membrane protein n=1 Tax=Legionella pneumophila TaxID=446 RepID=UPI0007707A5F|nr:TIGR03747 family integrating conjugative element membrane protein [Legionella pneumophila]CZP77470.1 integrating conjugative element membrane protein%2C PFL_4697 family [Legionella pneumophila]CZQ07296.1 integrating conjugative element membrane protein%2C PFL_4697 family [Legionella pneumophila]HDV5821444.1 TIGR03747 family integrating conjugative element membrane protein [Legionella pneumophila]